MPKIPYARPSITELEAKYAADAVANGWGEHCYDYIDRFEQEFCQHLGVSHAIATSSCTGALHMGLAALGISRGDEVILADINWIATAAPIVHLGARPVLVDILPDTWCIDPNRVEEAITPRTKAIIAVHLYGNLCDMNALLDIGRRHSIPVIEDAAEAIGSIYHGKRAGSMGHFGAFSFHGTKTITTGEGGMFVTSDPDLYETVLTLSNHGRSRAESRQFWPERIGFKYKMSNVQAAIGCAQLERIEQLIERKRSIFNSYSAHFGSRPDISMNPEYDGTTNSFWMPTLVVASLNVRGRQELIATLSAHGIDVRPCFWPLSTLPSLTSTHSTSVAQDVSMRAFNLPSFHDITPAEQRAVVAALLEYLL